MPPVNMKNNNFNHDDEAEAEAEAEPLVARIPQKRNINGATSGGCVVVSKFSHYYIIGGIIIFISLLVSTNYFMTSSDDVTSKTHHYNNHNYSYDPSIIPSIHIKPDMTLQSLQQIKQQFVIAQNEFYQILQVQYGKYYNDIFFLSSSDTSKSRGSLFFESGNSKSNISRLRLQRKLTMKILEASSFTSSNVPVRTITNHYNDITRNKTNSIQFVWATGGHSTAAGHGNFYNESYTAYMQFALENIFQSFNITFIGRNHAMGSSSSAPELAFCSKEIFGTDIDIISWDFAMSEVREHWKLPLFHYRTALFNHNDDNHHPIHVSFFAGDRSEIIQSMENMGLGMLISSEAIRNDANNAIPDSFGLSEIDIQNLPEYVRSFRCESGIEKGDPYCTRDKYRLSECPDRLYQASWHPGWKWHALIGYLISFYMIDVLNDAIKDLKIQLLSGTDAISIYNTLKLEEQYDYETFRNAPIPSIIKEGLPLMDDFNSTQFVSGPNYCHTARLPAEIRYLGILTETTTKVGVTNYDTGINIEEFLDESLSYDETKSMKLVYTKNDRPTCPIRTYVDFKDYYYIDAKSGWQTLQIPNVPERKAYDKSNGSLSLYGYVVFCMPTCPWDRCPNNLLNSTLLLDEHWLHMRVNGVAVTKVTPYNDCFILCHENGHRFPIQENNNKNILNTMNIEAQVIIPMEHQETFSNQSYARIGTWIVW